MASNVKKVKRVEALVKLNITRLMN